jgi:glutamate 5-kinase
VNENDTVATDEIRFGDNDNLSATIVNLVAADLLVILTDVDGLYPEPPGEGKPVGEPWGCIEKIDATVERAAGGSASAFGRGGMLTKLQAAKSAGRSGAAAVLCNGWRKDVLLEVAAGDAVGTLFRAGSRLASRKHWLAFTARPRGRVVLDDGAVRAIQRGGRSLLPAGVVDADGTFGIGDTVSCTNRAGDEIARGLVAYASKDVARIKGLPTGEISQVLGYSNGDELIHRDDLVLLDHD